MRKNCSHIILSVVLFALTVGCSPAQNVVPINDLRYEAVSIVRLEQLDDVRTIFLRKNFENKNERFFQENPAKIWLRIYMSSSIRLENQSADFPYSYTTYYAGTNFLNSGFCGQWLHCPYQVLGGAGEEEAAALPDHLSSPRDPTRTYYYTHVAVSRPASGLNGCEPLPFCPGYDLSVKAEAFSLRLRRVIDSYLMSSNFITVPAADIARAIREYRHPPRGENK